MLNYYSMIKSISFTSLCISTISTSLFKPLWTATSVCPDWLQTADKEETLSTDVKIGLTLIWWRNAKLGLSQTSNRIEMSHFRRGRRCVLSVKSTHWVLHRQLKRQNWPQYLNMTKIQQIVSVVSLLLVTQGRTQCTGAVALSAWIKITLEYYEPCRHKWLMRKANRKRTWNRLKLLLFLCVILLHLACRLYEEVRHCLLFVQMPGNMIQCGGSYFPSHWH